MVKKISEYKNINGLSKTASALIMENNLSISSQEDFERYFPDIVNPINNFSDFFEEMPILNKTSEFVETIKSLPMNSIICVLGDYDVDRYNGNYNFSSHITKSRI